MRRCSTLPMEGLGPKPRWWARIVAVGLGKRRATTARKRSKSAVVRRGLFRATSVPSPCLDPHPPVCRARSQWEHLWTSVICDDPVAEILLSARRVYASIGPSAWRNFTASPRKSSTEDRSRKEHPAKSCPVRCGCLALFFLSPVFEGCLSCRSSHGSQSSQMPVNSRVNN